MASMAFSTPLIARAASTRASLKGLPPSWAINREKSSCSRVMSSMSFLRMESLVLGLSVWLGSSKAVLALSSISKASCLLWSWSSLIAFKS